MRIINKIKERSERTNTNKNEINSYELILKNQTKELVAAQKMIIQIRIVWEEVNKQHKWKTTTTIIQMIGH